MQNSNFIPKGDGNAFELKLVSDGMLNLSESYDIESTIEVKVITVERIDGANKFVIDGNRVEKLKLEQNKDYLFDWSQSPSHPFKFSLKSDALIMEVKS